MLRLACPLLALAVVTAPPSIPAARRLTRDGKLKQHLAWSPDGKRLACSYYHAMGKIAVALMDSDGGNLQILKGDPVEFAPGWSPDGQRLVFIHDIFFFY